MKTCNKCGETKPLDEFPKRKSSKDGYRNQCKECCSQRGRESYERNYEYIKERERKRWHANRETRLAQNKEWRENNKERHQENSRRWHQENKEKVREYERNRRATCVQYRLAGLLRNHVRHYINGVKSAATLELLGCSVDQFKAHLEGLFTEGMSWDNYGKNGWHIDHIRPCASFDLTDPAQQRECFHYTNLQPMWETDNLSKGSLWEGKRYSRHS